MVSIDVAKMQIVIFQMTSSECQFKESEFKSFSSRIHLMSAWK